jgi:endonuclease/exonuclease/phosphatase family metal-dependent hydrolase
MRVLTTALVLAACVASVTASRQEGVSAGRDLRRRDPILAELSDMLVHSQLVPCVPGGSPGGEAAERVRIATWNIRAARSAPVEAIAAELRAMRADVIALQEVDVRTRRTGFVDEPAVLAGRLGFRYAFAASIEWDEGNYGLAVLSRWPLSGVQRHRLETGHPGEPRIVLEVTVCAGGRPLRLFNHHADRRRAARQAGFEGLRGILRGALGRGIVVLGDFNEPATAPGVRSLLDDGLVDLVAARGAATPGGDRIDHVLADPPLARVVSTVSVWSTDKSDHDAVLVDLVR